MAEEKTIGVSAKLSIFLNKWGFISFLLFTGFTGIAFGLQGHFQKYPNLNELNHISGRLINYSIVDVDAGRFSNHEITMHLEGVKIPIVFSYVDYFPAMKESLQHAQTVEIWIEPKDYKASDIWQLKVDSKMILPLDENIQGFKNRSKFLFFWGIPFIIVGLILWLMVASKNPFMNKTYRYIISSLVILGLIYSVWHLANSVEHLKNTLSH